MAKKEKQPKVRKPGYIGAKKFWAWQSREMSDAGFMFLMGYIVFYCTDVLHLNPLIVGSLFAASKIIDGITDVLVGYIVDRTNTRWGRGRPFDICLLGAWFSVIMIFVTPVSWGDTAKLAWVVTWYTLSSAVFYTFLNAGEGVFLLRAFNRDQIVKISSQGAIATSLLGFACGIFIPQMGNAAGKDPAAWIRTAITVAIPLTLLGLCRMIFVKEENDTVDTVEEKAKTDLRDIAKMLTKNRYWVTYCIINLISNIVTNMGVGVYYADKVLGNLGVQSLFAGVSALAVFALVLLPKLLKKFHLSTIIKFGCIASTVINLICFIFYKTLPVLLIGHVANIFVTLPSVYAGRLILFDAALYDEFKGLNRMEGTMNSMNGFMIRAGGALGTFLLGVALTLIGYDSNATTLAPATEFGLRFMNYGMPAISAALQALLWFTYDLEKRMPQIKEELAARRAAANAE